MVVKNVKWRFLLLDMILYRIGEIIILIISDLTIQYVVGIV